MGNPIRKSLLYEEVIKHILELVRDQNMLPGDKFPTERELASEWQVSRNALRESFHILEDRGIVDSYPGSGRVLRGFPSKEIEDNMEDPNKMMAKLEKFSFMEVYEVRKIIEVNAFDLIVERATEEDLKTTEQLYHRFVIELEQNGVQTHDFDLHLQYMKSSHNYMLEEILCKYLKLIEECKSPHFIGVTTEYRMEDYIRDHGEIIASIKERDAERAKGAMLRHLNTSIEKVSYA